MTRCFEDERGREGNNIKKGSDNKHNKSLPTTPQLSQSIQKFSFDDMIPLHQYKAKDRRRISHQAQGS